jgi:RimJ/RimL family protein N-acetyltransferase
MQSLPKTEREAVRPLYEGFPGLHGALEAAFEGSLGEVWVDDGKRPQVARMLIGDFHAIAGDPEAPAATEALLAVPDRGYIAVADSWHDLVHRALPAAYPNDRFSFHAPELWDRKRLASLRESLPPGYTLGRIGANTVGAFRNLNATFVDNFESLDDFLARGVGFGVTKGGEFVAGCSSYSISSHTLEIEIETRRDYWRRGLALVTGARMIEHCLDNGLVPCWDAAHEGSALLAERLGFVGRRQYTAYRLGASAMPEDG